MKRRDMAIWRGIGLRVCLVALLLATLAGSLACSRSTAATRKNPLLQAYDTEPDWNNPDHVISLNYQQAQGKRIFYKDCVWCHADSTPAGPSNRANVTPTPDLMNDGAKLNGLTEQYMENIIALGGAAEGKSPMMPAWGHTLTPGEIKAVIAFTRVIAQPPYQGPLQTSASTPSH